MELAREDLNALDHKPGKGIVEAEFARSRAPRTIMTDPFYGLE